MSWPVVARQIQRRRTIEMGRVTKAFGWTPYPPNDKAKSAIIRAKVRAKRIRCPAMLQPAFKAYHGEDFLLIMESRVGNYNHRPYYGRFYGKDQREWVYA